LTSKLPSNITINYRRNPVVEIIVSHSHHSEIRILCLFCDPLNMNHPAKKNNVHPAQRPTWPPHVLGWSDLVESWLFCASFGLGTSDRETMCSTGNSHRFKVMSWEPTVQS
jgi:hypothetical protein